MPSKFFVLFLIAIAVFGLALVPFLALQPNLPVDSSVLRRPLVGSLYTVICIFGIVAVFYPNKCRMVFQKPNQSIGPDKVSPLSVQLIGHHPNCEKFSANRIMIQGRVFCAACSGLLIGAIVAIVGIVLFSFGVFDMLSWLPWILIAGEVLMFVGLVQIKMGGYVKMIMNALFVIGSCVSLIAVDIVGQKLLIDVYMLGLIAYMLWIRILLSEWNNKKICLNCGHCI